MKSPKGHSLQLPGATLQRRSSASSVPKQFSQTTQSSDEVEQTSRSSGRLVVVSNRVPLPPKDGRRYINKTIGHTALAGLYRMARVGLVAPLRDGMNLVAKEFIAARDENDPGVLILSRFAGAMHELDAALLVNPYDTETTAAAIARAIDMPLSERRERWYALVGRLRTHRISDWCQSVLNALNDQQPSASDHAGDRRVPPRRRVAHAPT